MNELSHLNKFSGVSLEHSAPKTYRRICMMCPTYGRADTCLPVYVESALNTVSSVDNICMSFVVNKKDIPTQQYLKNRLDGVVDYEIILEEVGYTHLAKFFNMMYDRSKFNSPDILVSMLGDDMEFKTDGWDISVLNTMNKSKGYGLVYCSDNWCQYHKLCVNAFYSRDMVDMTGLPFMCELFKVDFIDIIWYQFAQSCNLLYYLPNVTIQHNHASSYRFEHDYTYKRNRAQYYDADSHKGEIPDVVQQMTKNFTESILGKYKKNCDIVMTVVNMNSEVERTIKSMSSSIIKPSPLYLVDKTKDGSAKNISEKHPFIKRCTSHPEINGNVLNVSQNMMVRQEWLIELYDVVEKTGSAESYPVISTYDEILNSAGLPSGFGPNYPDWKMKSKQNRLYSMCKEYGVDPGF